LLSRVIILSFLYLSCVLAFSSSCLNVLHSAINFSDTFGFSTVELLALRADGKLGDTDVTLPELELELLLLKLVLGPEVILEKLVLGLEVILEKLVLGVVLGVASSPAFVSPSSITPIALLIPIKFL